jgi:hypothetical protein
MEGLGFTRDVPGLANVLPGFRTVEQTNLDCPECRRLEVSRIDTGMGSFADLELLPLHDATASLAANESLGLVAPDVLVCGSRICDKLNLGVFVVRPQNSVATANGAIAVGQTSGLARHLNLYSATVAGSSEHVRRCLFVGPNVRHERQAKAKLKAVRSMEGLDLGRSQLFATERTPGGFG